MSQPPFPPYGPQYPPPMPPQYGPPPNYQRHGHGPAIAATVFGFFCTVGIGGLIWISHYQSECSSGLGLLGQMLSGTIAQRCSMVSGVHDACMFLAIAGGIGFAASLAVQLARD